MMGPRTPVQVSDHFVVTGIVPTEPSGGERVAFAVGFKGSDRGSTSGRSSPVAPAEDYRQ